jgi:hypothetical protein
MKVNSDECKQLAKYACQLVYAVDVICEEDLRNGNDWTKDLERNLEGLVAYAI